MSDSLYRMSLEFLIPFICLCVSFSWSACAKKTCEKNYDYVYLYNTGLWNILQFLLMLSIIAGVIIVWINLGFLMALAYFGIAVGSIIINQIVLAYILIAIFSYQGIGAIAPTICGIASAIWMFIKSGSL